MFKCDKCGWRCRLLEESELYRKLDRGDGQCRHFDQETNLCRIYAERPLICRVDEMYEKYFTHLMSKEIYYRKNEEACRLLKKEGIKNVFDDAKRRE